MRQKQRPADMLIRIHTVFYEAGKSPVGGRRAMLPSSRGVHRRLGPQCLYVGALHGWCCLLYTSDAADDTPCVDL
eukprot:6704236-Pyramimonas_sp.AAC.1